MANKKPNIAPAIIEREQDGAGEIMQEILDIYKMPKPTNDEEFEQRIDQYFEYCAKTGHRAGIENLCLCLHISRQALWKFSRGDGCSKRKAEAAARARAVVIAYLEQANARGKLNPATGIFLLKNWGGYSDTLTISRGDDVTIFDSQNAEKTIADIRERYAGIVDAHEAPALELDESRARGILPAQDAPRRREYNELSTDSAQNAAETMFNSETGKV